MKYRILKSVAHNFSHSFVSYRNYFDDDYVIEDLLRIVRESGRVSIYWIPDTESPAGLTPRIFKSIEHYKSWLPTHIADSGADLAAIREFKPEIFLKPNKQIAVEAHLIDDRGKEHVANVFF